MHFLSFAGCFQSIGLKEQDKFLSKLFHQINSTSQTARICHSLGGNFCSVYATIQISLLLWVFCNIRTLLHSWLLICHFSTVMMNIFNRKVEALDCPHEQWLIGPRALQSSAATSANPVLLLETGNFSFRSAEGMTAFPPPASSCKVVISPHYNNVSTFSIFSVLCWKDTV